MERAKNHGEGIELPVTPKVMKCQSSDREAPLLPLRPVEHDGAVTEIGKEMPFDVVAPDRTVGVDKEDVASSQAPPGPNRDMHAG